MTDPEDYVVACNTIRVVCTYRLYNEDEGLLDIHDRGRSLRTCLFDDPES